MSFFVKVSFLTACLIGCSHPVEEGLPKSEKTKPSTPAHIQIPDLASELSSEQARRLIPEAASLSLTEFREILEHPPVAMKELKNQSLTAVLLAVDPVVAKRRNPNVIRDFQYLTSSSEVPKPGQIWDAIKGDGKVDFVSIIQPNYISKCICLNRGDAATGRVEFRARNLYVGAAEFTARRREREWEIISFNLPQYHLVTKRQSDGSWRLESEELLVEIALP